MQKCDRGFLVSMPKIKALTEEQYRMLMQGLEVVAKHPIRELEEPPDLM